MTAIKVSPEMTGSEAPQEQQDHKVSPVMMAIQVMTEQEVQRELQA